MSTQTRGPPSSDPANDGLDRCLRDTGRFGDLGHRVCGCSAHVADRLVPFLAQVFKLLAGFSDTFGQLAEVFEGRRHDR